MSQKLSSPWIVTLRGTLAAAALAAASATSWALPAFTISPAAAGLAGSTVSGDNFIISDFSTTLVTGNTFSEQGFLAVRSLELLGDVTEAFGPSSSYGLYIAFSATGTLTSATSGQFNTLTYTLYGYNGTQARFGFSGNTTTVSQSGVPLTTATALAAGKLVSGTLSSTNGAPSANAFVTFTPTGAGVGFFASPTPFYTTTETSFTNTLSEVTPITGGFRIRQGGGSFNFFSSNSVSTVSEPETYALVLMSLAAMGFAISRRRPR